MKRSCKQVCTWWKKYSLQFNNDSIFKGTTAWRWTAEMYQTILKRFEFILFFAVLKVLLLYVRNLLSVVVTIELNDIDFDKNASYFFLFLCVYFSPLCTLSWVDEMKNQNRNILWLKSVIINFNHLKRQIVHSFMSTQWQQNVNFNARPVAWKQSIADMFNQQLIAEKHTQSAICIHIFWK